MVALERGLRTTEIAWLSGCCFIVRRGVSEALGGFDPDFFLYQEDTDFCLGPGAPATASATSRPPWSTKEGCA